MVREHHVERDEVGGERRDPADEEEAEQALRDDPSCRKNQYAASDDAKQHVATPIETAISELTRVVAETPAFQAYVMLLSVGKPGEAERRSL